MAAYHESSRRPHNLLHRPTRPAVLVGDSTEASVGAIANRALGSISVIWAANVPNRDYWSGILYMLALVHVSGNFHLYY